MSNFFKNHDLPECKKMKINKKINTIHFLSYLKFVKLKSLEHFCKC